MPPARRTYHAALWTAILGLAFVLSGCAREEAPETIPPAGDKLFTRLPASYTGIAFENRLTDHKDFNVFEYRNFYNGGGVGIGDFNNDGRRDVFLTANQRPNRLYLNQGGFRFKDVTDRAGVGGRHAWSTGVSVADVNGDGRPDIYVCNAGNLEGDDRANELYINQGAGDDGVPVFKEEAEAYGLADTGFGVHAAFFDYDRDGDLDVYLLNNSFRPASSFGLRNIRHVRDPDGGDKLFRNDGGRFTDVSEQAGIYGPENAFGLGVTVGDFDRDGWPDVYVSNDFFERDYFYVNNRDGTFTDRLEDAMRHISLSSMGADAADVNNDGLLDLYVTDMLPESDRRLKTTSLFESWAAYRENLRHDYYHQFMRNMLHLNKGNGTFTEVGEIAGVSSTDWSWSALLADFDLDGLKDIFVTNGIFKDLTNQDFIDFFASDEMLRQWATDDDFDFLTILQRIPSQPISNYAFQNKSDPVTGPPDHGPGQTLAFTNAAAAWGLDAPGFSNGAAYADLDDDGDLDLVVNNVNTEASVYRNEADTLLPAHYLQVQLDGEGLNRDGIGAQVTLRNGGATYFMHQMPTRGFQSSVDPVLTFGLGPAEAVDSLVVVWPDGRVQVRTGLAANQRVILAQKDALPAGDAPEGVALATPSSRLFEDVTATAGLDYVHRENAFVDFDREPLLLRMLSTEGPRLAVGDVNGDGLDDVFIGGAKESPGRLLLQRRGGGFAGTADETFARDRVSEDVDAAFFDADGDGDLDLYVVSGGSEFSEMAPGLQDRLYLNDGRGGFEKAEGRLPARYTSGACVAAADYDRDGDLDLFVGGRVVPWRYGLDPPSILLQNDGRGRFTDVTEQVAPALARIGMVTDAVWTDYDRDGSLDLVVVGDWMPLTLFRNTGGRLVPQPAPGLETSNGWWNRIAADDFDGDGDADFVAGNFGLNTRIKASAAEPATMHVADFDGNGSTEQIISYYKQGKSIAMPLRAVLLRQLPHLEQRYPDFAGYAEQGVADIFTPDELADAVVKQAHTLATSYVENRGDGTFAVRPLPFPAQLSPVFGILPGDFDGDGHRDVLLAGNLDAVQPELGRMDASYGLFLRGDGQGGFSPVAAGKGGFLVTGQARDMALLDVPGQGRLILVAKNDGPLQVFTTSKGKRGT